MKVGYVYILTNKKQTVLYVGVTSDIVGRIWEHKNKVYPKSFTARYKTDQLVYFELIESIEDAIKREKEIKTWRRDRKITLIKRLNPDVVDLYDDKFCEHYYN